MRYELNDRPGPYGLIISGGSLSREFALEHTRLMKARHPALLLIAADRGLEFCLMNDITPDVVVGDFDSADPKMIEEFRLRGDASRIISFPARKDKTDTQLALELAIDRGCKNISILGATGGRVDHLLGNIQLLELALDRGAACYLADERDLITMTDKDTYISGLGAFGDYISLIPWGGDVEGLCLTGFEYDLDDALLTTSSTVGISNSIAAKEAFISFKSGKLIVVQSRDVVPVCC